MEEVKSIFLSRTVIGTVITAIAFFAKAKGYEIDVEGLTGAVSDLVQNLCGTVGMFMALYGRVNATKRVGVRSSLPAPDQAGRIRIDAGVMLFAAVVLWLAAGLGIVGGCASMAGKSGGEKAEIVTVKTLGVASIGVKESKPIVDALFQAGKITASEYNSFAEVRKRAWLAFLVADDAAQAALEVGADPQGYPAYTKALADLVKAKGALDNMLVEFGVLTPGGK